MKGQDNMELRNTGSHDPGPWQLVYVVGLGADTRVQNYLWKIDKKRSKPSGPQETKIILNHMSQVCIQSRKKK